MRKIKTIFDRDWTGNKKVINKPLIDLELLKNAVATEKLDGTNVRLTVRNHTLVRLEKRCNPSKIQKVKGIEEPWYTEAYESEPNDRYMWEAAKNTDLSDAPDGEWSGEVLGPKVQGNPLNLEKHIIALFSLGKVPSFDDVPLDYEGLKAWIPRQKSKYGKDCNIEGIVWHLPNGDMYKIKCKDF